MQLMEIIGGARLPIYSWAGDVEAEALRQARNLGNLIETVMDLSADLVRPVTRLRPLGVVKG